MTKNILGPASHWYMSQRLRLHYVDWGNEEAPPLLLVHGGRDHCRNWDWVAQALREDYRVIAPDLRGHGDSQWAMGGTYTYTDFVYDIAQLIHQLELAPLTIIGHSLGSGVSLRYAGAYPDNVRKFIGIEGLGPGPRIAAERARKSVPERLRDWIDETRGLASRMPHRYATIDEAVGRMQEANEHLTPEQARHLTVHGVNRNEDGTFSWKFDNYVRAFTPFGIDPEQTKKLWECIACPTLLVRGGDSWAEDPYELGIPAHFRNAEFVTVEGASHWVHHDRLDEFLRLTREFLVR